MATQKVVFVAFAIEDERMRDFLKAHTRLDHCPFEYIDMSVKDAYDRDWKNKVRTRIRRSDGLIALISENSESSSGQKWEIQCAREEGVPILGIWAYKDDRTIIPGIPIKEWKWDIINSFIEKI